MLLEVNGKTVIIAAPPVWSAVITCVLGVSTVAGCTGNAIVKRDPAVSQTQPANKKELNRDPAIPTPPERVWEIYGERRSTTMFFPWYHRLDRDRYSVVRSDGQKRVGALASQSNENQPHNRYIYVVDVTKGKTSFVVPSISSSTYCLGSEYLVLVGDPSAGKQEIEIRSMSNGSLVRKGLVADYMSDDAFSAAMADNMVRLVNPEGERESFFEVPSGEPLKREYVTKSIKSLIDRGLLDSKDPWRLKEARERYPEQTHCADLLITVEGDRTVLVARREGKR